jgi:hypothetical protein
VVKVRPFFALFWVFLAGLSTSPAGATGDDIRPYAKIGLNELVVAEVENLRRQIRRCWKVPAATRKEDFDIHIRIELHPDGTVHEARVVDRSSIIIDPYRFSVAKSARRAIRSRPCNPLKIPKERKIDGRRITLTLNPRAIFGR